jgi:hypothetical protein
MAHRDGPGAPWSAQKRIKLRCEAALDGVVTMRATLASASANTAKPGHRRPWRERRPGFTFLLRVSCALGSAAVPDSVKRQLVEDVARKFRCGLVGLRGSAGPLVRVSAADGEEVSIGPPGEQTA